MPELRTWQEYVYLVMGCIEYKYFSWYLTTEQDRTPRDKIFTGRIPSKSLIDPGFGDVAQDSGLGRSEWLQLA
jgi:hypothetical protein